MSWGESGTDEGQFYCPHNIDVTPDGERVLVADRENSRVSVYTTGGELLDNWPAGHRPAGLCVGRGATAGLVFVAEQVRGALYGRREATSLTFALVGGAGPADGVWRVRT